MTLSPFSDVPSDELPSRRRVTTASMTWRVGTRACRFVLAFGMLSACSKCSPAGEPVAVQVPPNGNFTRVPGEPESEPIDPDSERRLVLGSDGQPIGEGGRARYTNTGWECPPGPEDTCENNGCGVHERVSCRANCDGYRTQYYTCENGSYSLRETLEPACQCAPKKLPAELAACSDRYVSVSPDGMSLSNACTLGLTCAGHELWVQCDSENDGTNPLPVLARSSRSEPWGRVPGRRPRCLLCCGRGVQQSPLTLRQATHK